MATRLDRKHADRTRDKIRVSQLVNLLQQNAEGKVALDPIRLRSIEILLRKALPDLSSVEHKIEEARPFALIPSVINDNDAWEQAATASQEAKEGDKVH